LEQRVLVMVKAQSAWWKTSGEILASQTSHSSIEKRRLQCVQGCATLVRAHLDRRPQGARHPHDGQAEPPPTAIQIALWRRSVQVDRIHAIEQRPSRSALTGDVRGGPNGMPAPFPCRRSDTV